MEKKQPELQSDRVWKELSRALMEPHPRLFFDTLLETDCLHTIFPEVYSLVSATETRLWHPEGNAYEHTMLVLQEAVKRGFGLEERMAALVHDFGKGLTPKSELPKHHGHDVRGVRVVRAFCQRLVVPTAMTDRLCLVTRHHMKMHQLDSLRPSTICEMFDEMGGPSRGGPAVVLLWRLGQADRRGRLGHEDEDVTDCDRLLDYWQAYILPKFADVVGDAVLPGPKIREKMNRARMESVKVERER